MTALPTSAISYQFGGLTSAMDIRVRCCSANRLAKRDRDEVPTDSNSGECGLRRVSVRVGEAVGA